MDGGVRGDGLWAPQRRALTLGLVLSVTFVASEALAVITVMPLVARELHGLALYGWVFSTFQLASLVGIVAAGRDADRHGPARPYVVGLVLFSAGLIVAGLAPFMWVLVAGRCLQGFGAGAVPAVAYVAIGRSLREAQRARMMAVLSTAWVIPGIVGPGVAAAVAHLFGWRWVFLGLIPLVALAGPIAVPALVRLGRTDMPPAEEHRIADAVRTALGAAFLLGALSARNALVGLGLAAIGAAVGFAPLRRHQPSGTLRAPRPARHHLEPWLGDLRLLRCRRLRHLDHHDRAGHSTLVAGAVVTASTLAWTIGAWIQARLNERWEGARLVRTGLVLILLGTAGMAWQLRPGVPVWEAFVAWSVAGLGMGLAYAPISLMMLRAAPPGREGWASASLNLADVLGIALGVGIGGAAVAAVSRGTRPVAGGVLIAFAVAGLAAALALVIAGRLPGSLARTEESPVSR